MIFSVSPAREGGKFAPVIGKNCLNLYSMSMEPFISVKKGSCSFIRVKFIDYGYKAKSGTVIHQPKKVVSLPIRKDCLI